MIQHIFIDSNPNPTYMFSLLQTANIADLSAIADTATHCVETILVEDKTPISSFNWSNAIIAFLGSFAGVLALIPTWQTFKAQKIVAENTQLLNINAQYGMMLDLVRHLYRNLVVMWAIANKMKASNYSSYPSEIHLTKAKISLENIHLELFLGIEEKYSAVNELLLKLRNYNYELDIAMKHFAQKELKSEVKVHDINTLLFKPGFLADNIVKTITLIYPEKRDCIIQDILNLIDKSHINNIADNKNCAKWDKEYTRYDNPKNKFLTQIFALNKEHFTEILNQDAEIECGKNHENDDKVLMIEL